MPSGFLYVLINSTMPGLAKVGKTTRNPTDRVAELSSATGVPSPFMLAFQQPVAECDSAELWVHKELEREGFRHAANREFFNAPLHAIIKIVAQAANLVFDSPNLDVPDAGSPGYESSAETLSLKLFDLGVGYEEGTDSVLRSHKKALEYFEQAAALGHAMASTKAAIFYMHGTVDGIRKDQDKALDYFRKAVRSGMWVANAFIAKLFMEYGQASGAEAHWNQFFEGLEQQVLGVQDSALDDFLENSTLICDFGIMYCLAVESKEIAACNSDDLNLKIWESLDRAITTRISKIDGISAASNIQTSEFLKVFDRERIDQLQTDIFAEEKFNIENLQAALCYAEGKIANAVGALIHVAETGNADAQIDLGMMYLEGRGVEKNELEAVRWLRLAADQDHSTAQYAIGKMHAEGLGVQRNDELATDWYRKAANKELPIAQYYLGLMYEGGRGVERNDEDAVEWIRRAADRGYPDAQNVLGPPVPE